VILHSTVLYCNCGCCPWRSRVMLRFLLVPDSSFSISFRVITSQLQYEYQKQTGTYSPPVFVCMRRRSLRSQPWTPTALGRTARAGQSGRVTPSLGQQRQRGPGAGGAVCAGGGCTVVRPPTPSLTKQYCPCIALAPSHFTSVHSAHVSGLVVLTMLQDSAFSPVGVSRRSLRSIECLTPPQDFSQQDVVNAS